MRGKAGLEEVRIEKGAEKLGLPWRLRRRRLRGRGAWRGCLLGRRRKTLLSGLSLE